MYYSVSGSNKARRAMLDRAVAMANDRLNISDDCWVDINVRRGALEDNAYGLCWHGILWPTPAVWPDIKSRKLRVIHIDLYGKLPDDWLVATLFHELKHAEQYALGHLSPCTTMWKGTDYSESNAYVSLPWEAAAMRFEERMARKWARENLTE